MVQEAYDTNRNSDVLTADSNRRNGFQFLLHAKRRGPEIVPQPTTKLETG
jgi:hypothetical protein